MTARSVIRVLAGALLAVAVASTSSMAATPAQATIGVSAVVVPACDSTACPGTPRTMRYTRGAAAEGQPSVAIMGADGPMLTITY